MCLLFPTLPLISFQLVPSLLIQLILFVFLPTNLSYRKCLIARRLVEGISFMDFMSWTSRILLPLAMFFYHNSCINVVSSTCTQAINWHNRFSHESDSVLKILSNKIPFALPNEFSTKSCYVCPIAKFRRSSFPSVNNVSDKPFDLIHCDIWGPYKHSTYDNNCYFLTIVDDCSRFTWIFLLI